jgi:hypothetical protein
MGEIHTQFGMQFLPGIRMFMMFGVIASPPVLFALPGVNPYLLLVL